ncbi:MAG: hypothetical protein HQ514_05725 [Rhodospirillales bacterium]|nr:hypothetical protein [Rhodospirillales bacterium]
MERVAANHRKKSWHHRRDMRFVMLVGAFLLAYQAYGYAIGPGHITDRLHARLADNPKRINIAVTSNFPPEAFHMGVYQRHGNMRGTRGSTAILYRVKPTDLRYLSRRYWIKSIDLAR